ncbi:MAG: RNA polymerase sigma factor [Bacteroidales bacterium]|nr:RNA polymerase sigma factor [Bacteroidales bacterium]
MPGIPDVEILKNFNNSSLREQAFSQLVKKYKERLYWHCRRIVMSHEDADDALQNTFMKVWNNLEKFRGDSELYTWLFRIATNESLSLQKNKYKFSGRNSPLENDHSPEESLMADPYFDGDELQLKFQAAIKRLPEKQRVVFNLKYFEEMKYDDMAHVLDTSTGSLKASYHHAVKKIKKYLEDE